MSGARAFPLVQRLTRPSPAGADADAVVPDRHPEPGRLMLLWPTLLASASAIAFVVVAPPVSDLQAALARESAVRHGVGLGYWFQWFSGGTTPGTYSLLTPWLSALVGAAVLGAAATVALAPLTWMALAGTRRPVLGVWVAVIAASGSLWSGRVPFALGCAVTVVALIGVRRRSCLLAVPAAILSAAVTPVTAAFLIFALAAWAITDRSRRMLALVVAVSAGAVLLGIAAYFGSPGPQPFGAGRALKVSAAALIMLLARPQRTVRLLLVATAIGAPVLLTFDNGLGANFLRFPYICLPALVVATAASRRWLAVLAIVPALAGCLQITGQDLHAASRPAASAGYYTALGRQLDRRPDLAQYRLETVQSTEVHTATTALLSHAALAGGWETQSRNRYDAILLSAHLDAARYRRWLDDNAVGYVALDRGTPATTPEYRLVARGLRYLTPVWSDRRWTLLRVLAPTPIVGRPAQLLTATQNHLTARVPCACRVPLQLHYSTFLEASGSARVVDRDGWAVLVTRAPGTYRLSGSVTA